MKVFRVIRLLRMLKLIRLFRASRILQRWEASINISNSARSLLGAAARLLLGAHWMSCFWGMLGREISTMDEADGGGYSWIDELASNKPTGMKISSLNED